MVDVMDVFHVARLGERVVELVLAVSFLLFLALPVLLVVLLQHREKDFIEQQLAAHSFLFFMK